MKRKMFFFPGLWLFHLAFTRVYTCLPDKLSVNQALRFKLRVWILLNYKAQQDVSNEICVFFQQIQINL